MAKAKNIIYKVITGMMCIVMLISACSCGKQKEKSFSHWNEDAPAIAALVEYVEDVTDKDSKNFVPLKDRIALFDMDGTLYSETAPGYLSCVVFIYRVLYDKNYVATEEMKAIANEIKSYLEKGKGLPFDLDIRHAEQEALTFENMTCEEIDAYIKNILKNTARGFNTPYTNLFYKPMIDVVDYLNQNDFQVYVCSGTLRNICRAAADGNINIGMNHIIGSDAGYRFKSNKDIIDPTYKMDDDDKLVFNGKMVFKCINNNKVYQMAQELGDKPILIFGNSMGDYSMIKYSVIDNPYRTEAFLLLCDDLERDYGNINKAKEVEDTCKNNGWQTISMKNDFKTIYGEGVEKVASTHNFIFDYQ